jgi:beta-mannosidase
MKRISFLVTMLIASICLQAQPLRFPLQATWQFTAADTVNWMPATVPGTVHTDLLANKQIPDPFFSDQEKAVQWVEHKDWIYQAFVEVPAAVLLQQDARLVFEGLDTHVAVYLNGQFLFRANNMFRTWRIPVHHLLRQGRNQLRLEFQASVRHDDSLAVLSPLRLAGENNRMYSRKAQYQYGWDWGPRLVTCGIW